MSTNGSEPETAPIKADHTEKDYEMILVVKVPGHGSNEHKRKAAAVIKRILQVKTHSKPDVLLVEDEGGTILTLTCTEVTWDAQEGYIE